MTTYKIGDIFYDDKEYSARAEFCNNNNLMIVEIAPDEKGRRFQIQAVPPPSAVDLAYNEIYELQNELREAKYDVEQVELFGMERADYEQKKQRCAEIIVRLRELNKAVQNGN